MRDFFKNISRIIITIVTFVREEVLSKKISTNVGNFDRLLRRENRHVNLVIGMQNRRVR